VSLNNTVIDLTNASCEVTMEKELPVKENVTITVLSGNLTFRRAQLLRIDEQENRVILSGIFNLKFLVNNRPEAISDGRFDVGISDSDFYCDPQ
jgi:hypothetical protein